MKHPAPEEWAAYVFGESSPQRKRELNEHLATCAECSEEIAGWQRSIQRLDEWELPGANHRATAVLPMVRFALAACFLLLIGFGFGRLFSTGGSNASTSALRAEFRTALAEADRKTGEQTEAQLQAILRSLPELVRAAGEDDRRAILVQLQRLQEQRAADFISLRRDLETVASLTAEEIRQANLKLLQFASASPVGE
jgi:hypothetical protein